VLLRNRPLPTPQEAIQQPFRAFPSWFLRIECDRRGKVTMLNEAHMSEHSAWHGTPGSAGGPTLSNVFGLADDGTTMYAVSPREAYVLRSAPVRGLSQTWRGAGAARSPITASARCGWCATRT
jgi:hypothetical protein